MGHGGPAQSHVDERQFHDKAIDRLQKEYKRLQDRIDRMYIDKLDGRIDGSVFRSEVGRIRTGIGGYASSRWQDHRLANQSYLDEGVALLGAGQIRMPTFSRKQPASEKRRLLDFVLSGNPHRANGCWHLKFRQPFDMIADAAMVCTTEQAAGVGSDGLHQSILPDKGSNLGPSG